MEPAAGWAGRDVAGFPSEVELVCGVFDDSGIEEELARGPVFSPEADTLLRQLTLAVDDVDNALEGSALLASSQWLRVVELARRALSAIRAALTAPLRARAARCSSRPTR